MPNFLEMKLQFWHFYNDNDLRNFFLYVCHRNANGFDPALHRGLPEAWFDPAVTSRKELRVHMITLHELGTEWRFTTTEDDPLPHWMNHPSSPAGDDVEGLHRNAIGFPSLSGYRAHTPDYLADAASQGTNISAPPTHS